MFAHSISTVKSINLRKLISSFVLVAFISTSLLNPAYAQEFNTSAGLNLPIPGAMITSTLPYMPLTLKGLVVHPNNALKFDFIMDTGNSHLDQSALHDEALKIIKYFLTSMTIPENDLWVNLSPYEKNRIIENNFGQTLMGRDLLGQDYILKQLTASLIYPETALGQKFWSEIYQKAQAQYHTTQIPVNTFNKVWIVPSEAVVWEHEGKVMIVKSHLKVMLEEDYLSLTHHAVTHNQSHTIASTIVRALVLPVLEREVNNGQHFAQLRQMYQAMILATWYKQALKQSILNKVYADHKKIKGVEDSNKTDIEFIYQRYLRAFKKGAFNLIREEIDPTTGQTMPRKYFSGGFRLSKAMITKNGLVTLALFTVTTLTGALGTLSAQAQSNITNSVGHTILVGTNVNAVTPSLSDQKTNTFTRDDILKEVSINYYRDGPGTIQRLEHSVELPDTVQKLFSIYEDPTQSDQTRLKAYSLILVLTDPAKNPNLSASDIKEIGIAIEDELISKTRDEINKEQRFKYLELIGLTGGENSADFLKSDLFDPRLDVEDKDSTIRALELIYERSADNPDMQLRIRKSMVQALIYPNIKSHILRFLGKINYDPNQGTTQEQALYYLAKGDTRAVNSISNQEIVNAVKKEMKDQKVINILSSNHIKAALAIVLISALVMLFRSGWTKLSVNLYANRIINHEGLEDDNFEGIYRGLASRNPNNVRYALLGLRKIQLKRRLPNIAIDKLMKIKEDGKIKDAKVLKSLNVVLAHAADRAMFQNGQADKNLGGISLNSQLMGLQINRDKNAAMLSIDPRTNLDVSIEGFVPSITNIKFLDLKSFLKAS